MTPVEKKTIELSMPSDLMAAYRRLSRLDGFALFKSDDTGQNRWDIVTALPYQSRAVHRVSDLQAIVEQAGFTPHTSVGAYPFQGGMIGYLSYDFGRQAHGIASVSHNPYADLPIACFNWYRWCIAVDTQCQRAVCIYETDEQTLAQVDTIVSLWHARAEPAGKLDTVAWQALWHQRDYEQAFTQIQQALTAGRCYQVNLTQPFRLQSTASPWQLFEHICRNNPVPYGAFIRYDDHQLLSFSPECFLTVDRHRVITRPIKGSIGRSVDNAELDQALAAQLVNSVKDRAENVMIVDLLRHDLSKIAKRGTVQVDQLCQVHSYPEVHHLVSEISAIKQDALSAFEVLLSAFPGGSITGAPKIEAMKMISELEATNRGPYCGSMFYYSNHGRLDSNIAIRTITALKDAFWLHAGGGIVIDSDVDSEYEECFVKLSAILKAINQR